MPREIKMRFCKKCHKRVIRTVSTSKDFYNVCVCGDGYLRVERGSGAEGFLVALATRRKRKANGRILPTKLPHTES